MPTDDVDKEDSLALAAAAGEVFVETGGGSDADPKVHVGLLSEEQTNAALAALEDHVDVMDAEAALAGTKRKADESMDHPPAIDENTRVLKTRRAPTRVAWEERLGMLKEYKRIHGDLLIPIRFKENPSLGKFVHNTREQYKLFHKRTPDGYKKKCSLTEGRIQQLDEIGFVWSTNRTERQDEDWNRRLQQLEEYKKQHGDCLVPHGYTEDPSFAEWIHRQRTTYAAMQKDKKPNKMVAERMERLKEVGFNFTVHSDKWMDHWNELKAYKDKHGQ